MTNEHVFESLANFVHPRQMIPLVFTSKVSEGAFKRVRRSVFDNMFMRFRRSLPRLLESMSVKSFFEDFLPLHAYTPRVPVDIMNTACFLCQDDSGTVIGEWLCVSVEIMRLYWDSLICTANKPHTFTDACQEIVNLLPGQKKRCPQCLWIVPSTAMYDEQVCEYCRCRAQGSYLRISANGVPVIIP